MYIENIVIGKSLIEPQYIFASDQEDWDKNEKEKTYFTDERYLPKILVKLGLYPSVSQIRKNKPDLMITFDKPDFVFKLKVKKKHWLWILVGEGYEKTYGT